MNYYLNFNTIWESMFALFVLSTKSDWHEFMYRGTQITGIDNIPKEGSNMLVSLFFVVFIVVGNFFLLNLLVGVVISTYNREKEAGGKNILLTEKQMKWLQNKIMLIQSKPMLRMKLPLNEWRQPFFYLAEFIWFDRFIYSCILTNTAALAV